jgi:tRNA(Ile)-lysidine synthase
VKSKVYSRWLRAVKGRGVFHAGQRLGVAVSGGPDSVLLFEFLREAAAELGITLAVVHFDHRLRGAESDGDEMFVRRLAESAGVPYWGGSAEVAQVARQQRRNLEATARELRYQFFFSLIERGRLDRVATAHTASDQAETVLMRLLRGAGARGLGGIHPLLAGQVVRPFLDLTRAEIRREIEARGLAYRLDSTNLDVRLRRNKIRRELLPLLEKDYNPGIVRLLNEQADRSRDEDAFLEQQARELSAPWRRSEGEEEKISLEALRGFAPAIRRRVLRQMLESLPHPRSAAFLHIEELLRFAAIAQSGRSLPLPGGALAKKEFDWLVFAAQPPLEYAYEFPVSVPGEVTIPPLEVSFRFKIVGPLAGSKEYNKRSGCVLDAGKLRGNLFLRNWRAGDRFRLPGAWHDLKLKELFRRRKIPRSRRPLWPVLVCGEKIVWVRGLSPAAGVGAAPDCQSALLIEEICCLA